MNTVKLKGILLIIGLCMVVGGGGHSSVILHFAQANRDRQDISLIIKNVSLVINQSVNE